MQFLAPLVPEINLIFEIYDPWCSWKYFCMAFACICYICHICFLYQPPGNEESRNNRCAAARVIPAFISRRIAN